MCGEKINKQIKQPRNTFKNGTKKVSILKKGRPGISEVSQELFNYHSPAVNDSINP